MRVFRRTILALLAGALIALITIAGLLYFTDAGRRTTARLGFWTAGQLTGFSLSCGSFSGNLFAAFTCRDFALSDSEGVFMSGRELQVDWHFAPILSRQLSIDRLRIADAAMTRLPDEEPDPEPFSLPDWPGVKLSIGSLALEQITFRLPGKPLLCFGGGGSVTIAEPVLAINAQFARCAGEGSLRAIANYRDGHLMIDTTAVDDGLVAAFLFGWDGAGASELRIAGTGPIASFTASLDATVRDGGMAMLRMTTQPIGPRGEIAAGVAGRIELAEGRAPGWAPARDGQVSVRLAVTPAGGVRADNGSLRWGDSQFRFQFDLPENSDRLTGRIDATLGKVGDSVGIESGEASAVLQGTRSAPTVDLTYALNTFRIDEVRTEQLQGRGTLGLEDLGRRLRFSTQATAENLRIAEALDTAIGAQTALDLAGTYVFGQSALTLRGLATAEHAQLTFDGELSLENGASGPATANLTLENTAEILGVRISSGATVTAEFSEFAPRTSAVLQIDSPMLAARGTFLRVPGGRITADLATTRTNTALLSEAVGAEFAGAPSLRLVAAGTFSAPILNLDLAVPSASRSGITLANAQSKIRLARRAPVWNGDVVLTSGGNAGPLILSAGLAWGGAQPIRIDLRETSLSGAPLEGEVSAAEWSGPWTGTLTLSERPLAPIAALTGRNFQGAGTLTLNLAADGDRQRAGADIAFSSVRMDRALVNATVSGRVSYLAGGAAEARLTVVDGRNRVTLGAGGTVGAETLVTLHTLEGEWSNWPLRLVAPVAVSIGDGRFVLSPADLEVAGGRLQLSGQRNGDVLSARAVLAALPVAPVAVLFDWPSEVEGRIGGTAEVSFTPATAQARVALTANDLAFAGEARDLEAADVSVTSVWDGRLLSINGQITGLDSAPAQLTATVPLLREPGGYAVAFPEHGPVTGRFTASARAERLFALLPLPEHRLAGALNIGLAVSGDFAAPIISGRATLERGSYESLELGTRLRNLDLALEATPDGALQINGTASDGGAGRVSLTGRMALTGARATVDARLETDNADLARTDEYVARGTARLAIARGNEGPARVTGNVRTTEVRFDLGQPLPRGVEEIAVIEINRPPELGAVLAPDRSPEFLRTAQLNIDIDMPSRVFVTGYGVNAEWRGDFDVRGTVGDPVVLGQLTLIRGDAEVLGREFELEQGTVTIDPFAPGNARIRIVGANTQPGLTVRVTAEGSAAAPRLEWSSTPGLPRDEILSRLYFGRASPNLSAYEAVQLAQLSGVIGGFGGTGGVLGMARRLTGLDVLRLEAPVGGTEGGPRVAVGKYITDRIYVGAVSGADTSSGALQVEVQVTPNITVQVETGADARNAVGVLWERDY